MSLCYCDDEIDDCSDPVGDEEIRWWKIQLKIWSTWNFSSNLEKIYLLKTDITNFSCLSIYINSKYIPKDDGDDGGV